MSLKNDGSFNLYAYVADDFVPEPQNLPASTPVLSTETVENIRRKARTIDHKAQNLGSTGFIPAGSNEVFALFKDSLALNTALRIAYLGQIDAKRPQRERELSAALPLTVSCPEHSVLRIELPPLIGRESHGMYDIYYQTKSVLSSFLSDHTLPNYKGQKLLLLYKKYTTTLSSSNTCDNDNWEMKRVTNAVAEALGYSDNVEHFSMLYTTVASNCNKVEATVLLLSQLSFFLPYLASV